MRTTALEIARTLGADTANPDTALTWELRASIARTFMLEVVKYLRTKELFTVRFLFLRKTITWGHLATPLVLLFDRAVEDMRPVEVVE